MTARSSEAIARNRILSLEAKRRAHGTCEDCGGPTRYAGKPGRRVSKVCEACARARRRYWTADKIIAAINAWVVEHGETPSAEDWRKVALDGSHPACSCVYSTGTRAAPFPTWNDAIRAAGFEPRKAGRKKKDGAVQDIAA